MNIVEYADELGGVYAQGNIEAIPYNHWKKDLEWIVLVFDSDALSMFIPVQAYEAREAVELAIKKFRFYNE